MKTLHIVFGPPSKLATGHEKALFFNHLHIPYGIYHGGNCPYKTWEEHETALFTELISNGYQLIYEVFREAHYQCEILNANKGWGFITSGELIHYLCVELEVLESCVNLKNLTETYLKIYQIIETKFTRKWARFYA